MTSGDTESLLESSVNVLLSRISSAHFDSWYRERTVADNIEGGTPYFNGPRSVPDPTRHSPSELLQCHRKITYRQHNAPAERSDPNGIFWFGTQFEEEIALPFLRTAVVIDDTYACNSLWVDFISDTKVGELRIKGETDPVIVDRNGEPIILTEIKTKQTVDDIRQPNDHHKAQVHAYMHGLSQKYDRPIENAVIIYGSRTKLDIKAFEIKFDPEFWTKVLDWAIEHSAYRLRGDLPPDVPEYDWECTFCSYRERCGRGNAPFADLESTGLVPLTEYPHEKLTIYLKAFPEAKLTPTLAVRYPGLVDQHGAYDWQCQKCASTFAYQTVEWGGNISDPPLCPSCRSDGTPVPLSGPSPGEQAITHPIEGSK